MQFLCAYHCLLDSYIIMSGREREFAYQLHNYSYLPVYEANSMCISPSLSFIVM